MVSWLAICAGHLSAATIVVGGPADPGTGNCIPFGCVSLDPNLPSNLYQQVYSNTVFSQPATIYGISFYNHESPGGALVSSHYRFSLAVTSKPVNGLDPIFGNNYVGETLFWDGILSGPVAGQLTITGTPFHYDPAQGNLLLEVERIPPVSIVDLPPGGGIAFDARNGTAAGLFSRMQNYSNYGFNNYGLVTGFRLEPEPGTLLLCFGGLAALAGLLRKRALPR